MTLSTAWRAIAIRTRSSSTWDPLPNAPYTVEEANIEVAHGTLDRRTVEKAGRSVVMEVRVK
jgi:hypothetical protein